MKIIKPSYKILHPIPQDVLLSRIEQAGRTCYKSEDKITHESAEKFVRGILKSGHESVIEHESISVRIVCDRGVSHELVRHRLASYSQSSTRYCNYSHDKFGNEITVIKPLFWDFGSQEYELWRTAMAHAEEKYLGLLRMGTTPQEARSVLPNSLATEIVMTTNLREWRHIFRLRSSAINKASHPQMREIADMMLSEFVDRWPVIFGGINRDPHNGKECLGPGCIYCDEDE